MVAVVVGVVWDVVGVLSIMLSRCWFYLSKVRFGNVLTMCWLFVGAVLKTCWRCADFLLDNVLAIIA